MGITTKSEWITCIVLLVNKTQALKSGVKSCWIQRSTEERSGDPALHLPESKGGIFLSLSHFFQPLSTLT